MDLIVLCVLLYTDKTLFFLENFHEREAQKARERSERDASQKREARGSEVTN